MKKQTALLPTVGVLLLLPSVALWSLWIAVFNQYPTHEQRVAAFLSYLPEFLRDRIAYSGVELLTSLGSLVCFAVSLRDSAGIWRLIAIVGVLFAAIALFMNLWQLM